MGIIAAPPREKAEYGSGIAKLLEMYLMQSMGALFSAPQQEAATNLDLLKEYGGQFTPEEAGALEQSIKPKTGIQGIIEKFRKPVSSGYSAVPGAAPRMETVPIELGANAEPGMIETTIDPNAQTLIPDIPTIGGRKSILQSIMTPQEGGTYRLPGREERLTAAFGKRAQLEEAAKLPWRREEEASKVSKLESTLATKENQIQMQKDWHEDMYKNMQDRIDQADRSNESKEKIASMKNDLAELKLTFGKAEAAWKEDVAKGKLEVEKERVGKIGQAGEKENIKTFEEDMIRKGYLKIDPKSKARTWANINEQQKSDIESSASQYGYGVSFKKEQTGWGLPVVGGEKYVPTVDYKTERSVRKTGEPEAKGGKPTGVVKPKSQADVDAALKAANEAIKAGKDPAKVKERLLEMGIQVK